DDQHIRFFGDALARRAAMLADEPKGFGPFHRREPTREGDRAFDDAPVGFGLRLQRPVFLLPAAAVRLRVPPAAGLFLGSQPMLAGSASIRLTTRAGVGSSFGCWMTRPACLARSISTSAVS